MRYLKKIPCLALLMVAGACGCSGSVDAPTSSSGKRETSPSSTEKGQVSSNSTDKGQASRPATEKGQTSPTPVVPAAITVTAEQLANDYKADSAVADRKYQQKLLAVEGLIQSLSPEFEKKPEYLLIEGVPAEKFPIHIRCTFADNELPRIRATKFQSGQRISVQGKCAYNSPFVYVSDCRLVSLSESPELLSADALAKEIDNASKGIKFARLDFRLDDTPMTIEVPEGATAKAETAETKITWGNRFGMSITLGRKVVQEKRVNHSEDRPIVNDPDLFLSRNWLGGYVFVTALERGYQDFTLMRMSIAGEKIGGPSHDDCLLMLKCARTLALKTQPPQEPKAALQALGGEIKEQDGKVIAVEFHFLCEATDATLKLLKTFPDLERLKANERMTEYGLTYLGSLKKLTVLDLTGCSLSDDGVSRLAEFTQLKKLNLTRTTITDKGLAHLSSLKDLQELDLSKAFFVTPEGVKKLRAALPKTVIKE